MSFPPFETKKSPRFAIDRQTFCETPSSLPVNPRVKIEGGRVKRRKWTSFFIMQGLETLKVKEATYEAKLGLQKMNWKWAHRPKSANILMQPKSLEHHLSYSTSKQTRTYA